MSTNPSIPFDREGRLLPDTELKRHPLEQLLAQVPAAIGYLNGPEHRWTYVNEHYVRVTGRNSAADFIGKTLLESLPEIQGQGFVELMDQVYRTGETYVGREMKAVLNRSTGGQPPESYWDFFYQPVRNASGQVEGILVHAIEVTDRVAARKAIDEAQRLLSAIVESSDDAIISKDLNSIVTSWNRCAEKMFGYTAEEMIGKPITMIIPLELHSDEDMILGKIRRGEKIDHFETVRVTKSGKRIEVSLSISPIRDEHGKIVGAAKIARDITENKTIERALRTTEKLAAAGRLAATVAHEINNPLEAVTNLVYLAKRDLPNVERVASLLLAAERELDRVAHIARQTLGFYRDTSSPVRFNVAQTLDDLLQLYERRMETRKIRVVRQFDKEVEITALAGEIRQAFSNLISNSLDAMPFGGSLLIRVSKSYQRSNFGRSGIRVTILDTGSGIAPEHRKSLFEPFFTTKTDVGTGLGLWITRNIVEKHGGVIRMRSRTGPGEHGTAFSIFLPSGEKSGGLQENDLAAVRSIVA